MKSHYSYIGVSLLYIYAQNNTVIFEKIFKWSCRCMVDGSIKINF